MYPVLGWEVIESQQNITIFRQALNCFGVLGFERLHKQIKGLPGLLSRLGHPDIMEHGFGLWLNGLGHFVEDIGCLMYPAALFLGRRVDLSQSRPKAQCSIAGRQLGSGG